MAVCTQRPKAEANAMVVNDLDTSLTNEVIVGTP